MIGVDRTNGASRLAIGMDVGSTTVKAVVVDPATKKILWSDYQRHHTKQPEYVLSMLETILGAFPDHPKDAWRMYLTGSGAGPLCAPTGGKFVQEVNAVGMQSSAPFGFSRMNAGEVGSQAV